MKEKKRGLLPVKFLWQYRSVGLMLALYGMIFALFFFLYDVRPEREAVLYAGGLCGMLTAGVLAGKYISAAKGHRERQRILQNIDILLEELPPPGTLAEADYQEMLAALKTIYDTNFNAWQNERKESMDYYTTWVHQIKTPISVMRMELQEEDTEKNRELLAELFRIEQYVGMVLQYLRLTDSVNDFVLREYELDGIIRQAVKKYAPMFIQKKLALEYETINVRVVTDEKWMVFVIEQLLSNAIKYTSSGSVRIGIKNGCLMVEDTGIGVLAEDLPRIFDKGYTGYNGRNDKKASGIGLYLVKEILNRLGHKILAESAPGDGTRIKILF